VYRTDTPSAPHGIILGGQQMELSTLGQLEIDPQADLCGRIPGLDDRNGLTVELDLLNS
jgi:hypothetical protein